MIPPINILLLVDSVATLADAGLKGHLMAYDDGLNQEIKTATDYLETRVIPGQRINWKIIPLDLQTPAAISNIIFEKENNDGFESPLQDTMERDNPDLFDWTAIVPYYMLPGIPYKYTIEILIGHGENSLHQIHDFALIYHP
jgi:hypothetical protein